MCEKSGSCPNWQQLEHAIKRNFGGLDSEKLDPYSEFKKEIDMADEVPDLTKFHEEVFNLNKNFSQD